MPATKRYSKNILTEGPETLLQVDVKLRNSDCNHDYRFEDAPARKAIRQIFSPDCVYTFMRTSVNPEAAEEIPKHNNELARIRGIEDKVFYFDASVMDTYLGSIERVAKKRLGKKSYASFPLVANHGVNNLDRSPEQPFWPVIHVIKDEKSDAGANNAGIFRELITCMNADESIYKAIKKLEAPMNYNMGTVDLLRKHGISPLVLHGREWQVDSSGLRDAVDFLLSWTNVKEYTGHVFCED